MSKVSAGRAFTSKFYIRGKCARHTSGFFRIKRIRIPNQYRREECCGGATDRFWLREIGHCCLNQPRRRAATTPRLSSFYQMRRKIPIGNSGGCYFMGSIKTSTEIRAKKRYCFELYKSCKLGFCKLHYMKLRTENWSLR